MAGVVRVRALNLTCASPHDDVLSGTKKQLFPCPTKQVQLVLVTETETEAEILYIIRV